MLRRMGGGLLTQWIAKYGYLPIVVIGVASLTPVVGAGEWKRSVPFGSTVTANR